MTDIHTVTLLGASCVRCGQPFTLGEKVSYNSDSEPGHVEPCEPSEEYATEQMDRLSRHIFGGHPVSTDTTPIGPGAFIDASETVINYKGRNYYSAEGIDENTSDGYHSFKELYQYRLLYNAALFNEWTESHLYGYGGPFAVHKSRRHSDGEPCFGGGWFVVVAQLPTGQISNHYRDADWDLFRIPERETAAEWDGHTPADVADRLLRFLRSSLNQSPKENEA